MTDLMHSDQRLGEETAGQRLGRLVPLARWWPALLGLAIGVIGLLDLQPWSRSDPPTWMPIGLALAYLVFGMVRGQLHRPGVLRLELVGLVLFTGTVVLALLVDTSVGNPVSPMIADGMTAHASVSQGGLDEPPAFRPKSVARTGPVAQPYA